MGKVLEHLRKWRFQWDNWIFDETMFATGYVLDLIGFVCYFSMAFFMGSGIEWICLSFGIETIPTLDGIG